MTRLDSRYWASAFYLIYYGATGALLPYLNLFYQRVGIDSAGIGVLAGLATVTGLFAAPVWGALSDTLHLHRRVLPLAMLGTLLPVLLLNVVHSFAALVLLVFAFAICLAPIIPLADNAVLAMLGSRHYEYGRLRLWGSVGFGLVAWVAGALIQWRGIGWAFGTYIICMALAVWFAVQLPVPRLSATAPLWRGMRQLVKNVRVLSFFFGIFMAGVCFSILNNYFILFVNGLGISEGLFGLSVTFGTFSELPIFFLAPMLLRRLRPQGLLILAMVILALRALIYSLITDPVWAVPAQLLAGPTFSALWTAGVTYTNQMAPEGLGTSSQAVFGAVLFGVAGSTGAVLGGALYDVIGPVALFRVAAVIALLALAVFSLTELRARRA